MRTDSNPKPSAGQSEDLFEFPCSFAQERFWLLEQVNADSTLCNIPLRWRLEGALDAKIAEAAFAAVISRHESLRTRFEERDGEPVQIVAGQVPWKLAMADLRNLEATAREREVERLRRGDAGRPFDLSVAPLLRVTLVRLGEGEHLALVTLHHMVCDGWSTGVLAREFVHFYEALSGGQPNPLPELAVQYPDYTVWERENFAGDEAQEQLTYWKNQLADLKYFEIPPDLPRTGEQNSKGDYRSLRLTPELVHAVKAFSRTHSVTMHTTALAALKAVLWRASGGQEDITLGSQTAGRNQVELEDLIGVFVNTVVLRTQVEARLTFRQLVARVDQSLGGAIANQDVPFERLVAELRPKRDPNRTPFFSINLIYQRTFIEERRFAGLTLQDLNFDTGGAIYDLNFYLVEHGDEWRFFCEYSPDRYRAETVDRLLRDFEAALRQCTANPDCRIEQIQMADASAARATHPKEAVTDTAASSRTDNSTAQLTKIWEEVLDVRPVDLDADFFDLGGHSLLATRLLARVHEQLGKKVKLATLFENPTIRQLASAMKGRTSAIAVPGIVNIQPLGSRTPMFCLHGVPSMALLARELGEDQPFYAVHLPEGTELKPPYTVEAIARIHVRTIRQFQPEGPYLLVGWCREGLLAYEVAQQLRAQGQAVDMLIMFDTWKPNYPENLTPRQNRGAARSLKYAQAKVRLQELAEMGAAGAAKSLVKMVATVLDDSWRHLRWQIKYRSELKSGNVQKPRTQDEMLFLAVDNYTAHPYDSPVLLFRSDKYRTWKYWDRLLGWGSVLPHIELHEIPGVHDSMLTGPSLAEIARAVAGAAQGLSPRVSFSVPQGAR